MSIKTEAVEAELAMMMDPEAEAGKQIKFDSNRSLSVPRTFFSHLNQFITFFSKTIKFNK